MQAVIQDRYGTFADLRVGEVPAPAVGPTDVLVRMRAASLHPDVWHAVVGKPYVMRFMGSGILRPKNPIPGTDLAGVVEATGPAVNRFQSGDEVFGETSAAMQWAHGGAYAELVAVPEQCLAAKPPNVTFEQAATVPASGYIALLNLPDPSELGQGREVLINGAGGGVGSIALQIIKSHGARVTAVDTTSKLEMLRTLGADRVIDYTREDFLRGAQRYDFLLDVAGHSFYRCKRVLKPNGRYVPIGHQHYGSSSRKVFGLVPYFLGMMILARFEKQLGTGNRDRPSRHESIVLLAELLATGAITPMIDSTYPFAAVHEAFRHLMEDELQGKVLLTP